ncbi:unnamed protein product [Rhizophagus irregularis]|nr:unnamed protein product [Rhizophagus irregularis]
MVNNIYCKYFTITKYNEYPITKYNMSTFNIYNNNNNLNEGSDHLNKEDNLNNNNDHLNDDNSNLNEENYSVTMTVMIIWMMVIWMKRTMIIIWMMTIWMKRIYDSNDDLEDFEDNINETIVDEALKSKKYSISTRAYGELVDILKHSQFRVDQISTKKTPSTASNSKPAYYLLISDIIWYVLNNELLFNKIYFGPAVETQEQSEFWHVEYQIGKYICYKDNNGRKLGRLLAILNDINSYKLKGQCILTYNELPRQFQSNSRLKELRLIQGFPEPAMALPIYQIALHI